jgi:NADP-dependent 3-hydroxy acid dehydrogenase YdfG
MSALRFRVVAITGAASGIGAALVRHCLAQGAYVAAADVRDEALRAFAAELGVSGEKLLLTALDVADAAAMKRWAEQVVQHFGYVDALINNAGVALSSHAANTARADMEWLFNVNFWGVVNGCEAFIPYLREQPRAHIVNLSSLFGLLAVPSQSAYNAAKFAVRGYSEALRQDLAATPIRVCTVHPGGVRTQIARHGRHFQGVNGAAITTEQAVAQFERLARTTPEVAAERIVRAMLKGRPRVLIGRDARLLDWLQRLLPGRYPVVLRLLLRVSSPRR